MLELIDDHGVLLRRDAVAAGYDDNALARMVGGKVLTRLRQGAYASTDLWGSWSPVERHRAMAHAVLRQYAEDSVAASHGTAVQLWGGPSYGLDLSQVHITSLLGVGGRRQAGLVRHRGDCRVADVTRHRSGHWITSPTRTVLDSATLLDVEGGVVVTDWFLQEGLTSKDELRVQLTVMNEWPHTLHLRRVVDLADERSESVGESRARMLFRAQGLPAPVLQWVVLDGSGRVLARVDFAWPEHRLMVEFDGREKYLRHRRVGESIEDAVLREKRREDHLRELTGFRLVRLVWADLYQPALTAERIRRAMRATA